MDLAGSLDHFFKNSFKPAKGKKTASMRKMKFLFVVVTLLLSATIGYAQDETNKVDMADTMRSNGRIYVVVAVVVLILIGLILYLVRLDRKITKMEKEK